MSGQKRNYTQLSDSQLNWFHMFCQWLSVRLMKIYFTTRFRLRIKGRENRPAPMQSYVAACNHVSLLDPPLLSVILDFQPVAYMAKRELFEKPLMRAYLWSVSSFAVNREKLEISTVKTALKVLKDGRWALGIFPEGTRQADGSVGEAKRGVAYFAKAANVPVLPVGIAMVGENKTRIEARIGRPIPPEDDLDAFLVKINQAIAELVEDARAGR